MKNKTLIKVSLSILEIDENYLNEKKILLSRIDRCFYSLKGEKNHFFDYFLEKFFYKSFSIKDFQEFSDPEIKSLAIYSIYLTRNYLLQRSLQK